VAAGVAAVLAVGVGAGFAIGALTNDKQKKDVARASTSTDAVPPVTAVPPTTTTPTTPTTTTPTTTDVPPATATPPTTPTTPTTPGVPPASTPPNTTPTTPPSTGSGIAHWPAGTTGYTVVLVSASTHKQANTKAREAISRGINAGVLRSNNYSSLNPGYWVVFAGQYSSANEARSHIDEYATKGFAGGYPRQIKK
jgi:hypothetical protein